MPPAVHPVGIYRCIGRQAAGQPAQTRKHQHATSRSITLRSFRQQIIRKLTRSYWQPWGLTPTQRGTWAYWQRTERERAEGEARLWLAVWSNMLRQYCWCMRGMSDSPLLQPESSSWFLPCGSSAQRETWGISDQLVRSSARIAAESSTVATYASTYSDCEVFSDVTQHSIRVRHHVRLFALTAVWTV